MKTNNCSLGNEPNKVLSTLRRIIPNNNAFIKYKRAVWLNNEFVPEFKTWYKNKYKKEPSVSTTRPDSLARRIVEWYNSTIPSVHANAETAFIDQKVIDYGYTDTNSRQFAIKSAGTILLEIWNSINTRPVSIRGDKLVYYTNQLINNVNELLLKRLSQINGTTIDEERESLLRNGVLDLGSYVYNRLGADDMIDIDKNLYGLFRELNSGEKHLKNFMREVLFDSRLGSIYGEIGKEFKDSEEKKAQTQIEAEETSDPDGDTSDEHSLYESDMSILKYNSRDGQYKTFTMHISERVRNYFNTLRKCLSANESDGTFVEDTNTPLGIADTMDASACASMIYNRAYFHNVYEMIEEIKKIGRNIPGFEAFSKFAYDLEQDMDFATEVCTIFLKSKMTTLEVRKEGSRVNSTIANTRVTPRNALLQDLATDYKGTALNMDFGYISNLLDEALANIDYYSSLTSMNDEGLDAYEKGLSILKQVLLSYLPTIDERAIDAYIDIAENTAKDDNKRQANNAKNLIRVLKELNNNAVDVVLESEKIKQAIKDEFKKPIEDRDFKAIYATDVLDNNKHWGKLSEIVDYLLPYSVVNTDLNSRNIKGNNQSQVMNNNLVTQIDKMLNDTTVDENGELSYPALIKWGNERVNNPQYKYNPLLFPQYDKDNNRINSYCLFNVVNGKVSLTTKNPSTILRIYKHLGSANIDNGVNSTYADMTSPSFGPTAYFQCFNGVPDNDYGIRGSSHLGTFFLRTPSDAPQAYVANMPKVLTDGLVNIDYGKDVYDTARSMTKELIISKNDISKYVDIENDKGIIVPETAASVKTDRFVDAFFNRGSILIDENVKGYTNKETGETYYAIGVGFPNPKDDGVTKVNKKAYSLYMIVKGDISSYGKRGYLDAYTVVGLYQFMGNNAIVGNDIKKDDKDYSAATRSAITKIYEEYNRQLSRGDVVVKDKTYKKKDFTINREHVVVKLLLNQFKQELLDAAVAINHYFDTTPDGKVNRITDKNNPDVGAAIEINDTTKGYNNYHKIGDSVIKTTRNSKGKITNQKLTGKVFGSNKFTMFFDGKERNYMAEMFSEKTSKDSDDGVINFLYGGVNTYLRTIKDENGNVIDINLTDKQEQKAIDCIVNFIRDYVSKEFEFISQYEDVINNDERKLSDISSVVDFSINYFLAYCNYDTLFEGDTKFYKDAQTILKRAKEYQGSGVPLGLADYNRTDGDGKLPIKSFIDNGFVYEVDSEGKTKEIKVSDFLNTGILKGLKMHSTFRAVTIKNTQKTHEETLERLVNSLKTEAKISEDKARDILYGPVTEEKDDGTVIRRGGFQETKVNDAQSYITFDEWVRRIIAKGQFRKYYPLIKKLNDHYGDLDEQDVAEFMQVQKNFYYDLHYDKRYGIVVPRQIKNAELVLHPRLIRGTELEHVYYAMKKAGIDQLNTVETSKASNEEVLTLWDNDGNISQEAIDSFIKDAPNASDEYNYNNLYVQIETPQHVNALNKAGIQLMKKIIDNIPNEGHILSKEKDRFIKNYVENIKQSFKAIMDKYEIPVDKNGNFIIDAETGKIGTLNQEVVFDKLAEELMRRGVNANMLDYVTIENGEPLMPIVMSNTISTLENVFQSTFNSGITSQKLPGLHGVQVTNVGWRKLTTDKPVYISNIDNRTKISKEEYDKLSKDDKKNYHDARVSYSSELRYHPEVNGKVEHYIEIKLPLSHFGLSRNDERWKNDDGTRMADEEIDAIILKELEKEGLDKLIGYRIPTEGKQSAAVMKVVGFVPDELGSSIVVPDNWVSQTGSDFDVDSVYCIGFNSYVKNGRLHKIKYIGVDNEWNSTERTLADYVHYVRNNKVKEELDDFNKLYNEINKEQNEAWAALEKYESEFEEDEQLLPIIKARHAEYDEYEGLTKRQKAIDKLQIVSDIINAYVEDKENKFKNGEFGELDLETFDEAIKPYRDLRDTTNDLKDYIDNRIEDYSPKLQAKINEFINKNKERIEAKAVKEGLMSYNDFISAPVEAINSVEARNNAITQSMINILSNPAALEENLSRSNFDDIISARNSIMNESIAKERAGRSPYIISDQIMYQEDAMSGYALKGMSVALDSLCSVCNQVKATLSDTYEFEVIYDGDKVNINDLIKSFGAENVDDISSKVGPSRIKVRHNKYGWSLDNYNVAGKILTSYSSQTTAHILDAIKEGAIPGVNTYTFSVYKTLVQVGSNYDCAVSFIMQPGVDRIVKAFNRTNSVFNDGYKDNPIDSAIHSIAKDLGIVVKGNATAKTILKKLRENEQFVNKFKELFGKDAEITLYSGTKKSLPIDVEMMIDRIKGRGMFDGRKSKLNKVLFDLGMILTFDKIHYTADNVSNTGRCLNPDKFGAKQTVYETRQVFDKVQQLINEGTALRVGKESILSAIYPNINKGLDAFISENITDKSAHPIMYAFLRFATAPSIKISEQVIPTERKGFYDSVRGIVNIFSGLNPYLTNEQYKDVKMYMLKSIYDRANGIVLPIDVVNRDGKLEITYVNSESNVSRDILIHNEAMRIYGLDRASGFRYYDKESKELKIFDVKDLNNPTLEECQIFLQLSPAQKVQFIKTHFRELGIFEYLRPNTSIANGKTWRSGMHTISYTENKINENTAFALFREAFYNKNMLVKLAAYDVIKYGVVFEGMRMRATAINKVIDNLPLRENFGNNGTGLVNAINEVFDKIHDVNEAIGDEELTNLYERYLRSHPDSTGVKTLRLNKSKMDSLGIASRSGSMYAIVPPRNKDGELDMDTFMDNCIKAGIYENSRYLKEPVPNHYIRISEYKKGNHLYKIIIGTDGILLYPFNNLMEQETSEISINPENQEFQPKEVYENLINVLLQDKDKKEFSYKDAFSSTNITLALEGNNISLSKPTKDKIVKDKTIPDFNQMADDGNNEAIALRDKVINTVFSVDQVIADESGYAGEGYIVSNLLSNYNITSSSGIEQTFVKGGSSVKVIIKKVNTSKYINDYVINDKNTDDIFNNVLKSRIDTAKRAYQEYHKDNIKINDLYYVKIAVDDSYLNEVKPDKPSNLSATLESTNYDTLLFAQRRNEQGEKIAIDFIEQVKQHNIGINKQDIKDNAEFVISEAAKYYKLAVTEVVRDFNAFVKVDGEENRYYKITDPEVQDLLKNNVALQNKYMSLLNRIDALKKKISAYREFKITSDTADDNDQMGLMKFKGYIESIEQSSDKLFKLDTETANKSLMEGWLKSQSTDPLVHSGMISLAENYHRTYGSMWQFHDIMENGNSMLQVILTNVMNDLESRRIAGERAARRFKDGIAEIERKAKAAGVKIDRDKFITKDGKFVQDFESTLIEDFNKKAIAAREAARLHGYGSIEHLKAKYAVDLFKYLHFEQAAEESYYKEKLNREKLMIQSHPKIYSDYQRLNYKRLNLYKGMNEVGLTPEQQNELKEIRRELNAIIYNTEGEYSNSECEALRGHIDALGDLNRRTFKNVPAETFQAQLDMYLGIIDRAENRDSRGVPQTDELMLANNQLYQTAIEWVRNNAYRAWKNEKLSTQEFRKKMDKCLRILGRDKNGKPNKANLVLKGKSGNNENCYDENGIPDGRKVTKENRESIKRIMEANYKVTGSTPYSDTRLIGYKPRVNYIFKSSFYNGMKPNGVTSSEFNDICGQINKILSKYIDHTGALSLQSMGTDPNMWEEEFSDLKQLATLYRKLRGTKRTEGSTNGKSVKEYIKENVKFETDKISFDENKKLYNKNLDREFRKYWLEVHCDMDEDGNFLDADGNVTTAISGNLQPNRYLYGYAMPKVEEGTPEFNALIDEDKTEAINFLDRYYRKTPTKYYALAMAEVRKQADDANDPSIYNKWWDENHIYNPYTHRFELLDIWVTSELNENVLDDYGDIFGWVAKGNQVNREVNDGKYINEDTGEEVYVPQNDHVNKKYVKENGLFGNYIIGSDNGKYDSKVKLNEYEKRMRDYLHNTIMDYATTNKAQRFFKKGNLPVRAKEKELTNAEMLIEASKFFGFNTSTNNGDRNFFDDVEYSSDVVPDMPMTQQLIDPKRTEKFNTPKPKTTDDKYNANGEFDEELYNEDLEKWDKARETVDEKNEKIHQDMLDRNWYDVIEDFILKANHYNAVRTNKDKLFYLLNFLEGQEAYIRKYGGMGDFKKDSRNKVEDEQPYVKTVDAELIKQLKNQIRRILYDQWKEAEGPTVAFANNLQGLTSANYMMLNIKGGIANVTLGLTGMFTEAIGKEFVGHSEILFGMRYWGENTISFIRGMYKKTATTKADAMVKFFNVVDYDEVTGTVRTFSPKVASERLRDLMFTPQTAGEHFMQNSMLFAMTKSHKIVKNPYNNEYTYMNFEEYARIRESIELDNILTPEQREVFRNEINKISTDANNVKDYAWRRKDIVTEFMAFHLDKTQREAFKKARENSRAKYKEEFDKIDNIFDQLELGSDGYLTFKEGSLLASLADESNPENVNIKDNNGVTIADKILGGFSERVKKTNNKIHGVYNKMGAAYIERKWYGSLIMQYHKHLPFGLLKRYRARGFFSETRGSVEKGMYTSLKDFLNLNFRRMCHENAIDYNEMGALESLQTLFSHILQYGMMLNDTFSLLPEYEKANIRRNRGGIYGTLAAIATVVGLLAMGAGGDDDDRIATNLILYEADRLASEAFMYTPLGMLSETKKLMSTPIAAQSIVNDWTKTMAELSSLILYGEDSSVYQSGRFAGQSKYTVFIKRRIPAYAGINSLIDIPRNNHYFKMGKNALSIVPTQAWAETIRTTFE